MPGDWFFPYFSPTKLSWPAISNIATLTAQGWGSARYALDLFKEAGMVSEASLAMDDILPFIMHCISSAVTSKVGSGGLNRGSHTVFYPRWLGNKTQKSLVWRMKLKIPWVRNTGF